MVDLMDLGRRMKKKVIIIGGGPSGFQAAISCSKAGIETILIEQEQLGGTCVNRGCVPTRIYLEAVRAKQHLDSIGVSASLDPCALRSACESKITQLGFGAEYVLRKNKVTILRTSASVAGEKRVKTAEGEVLDCDALVIATGSEPNIPKDSSCSKEYTVSQLLTLRELPAAISVVGAGPLGLELSVILSALGVAVTLIEKEKQILPEWDQDISGAMSAYLMRNGIEIKTDTGTAHLDNAVFCTGQRPHLPEVTAPNIDLQKSDWVYVIGDADGGAMTADIAIEQGSRIARRILYGDEAVDIATSKCIFTPLQAASAGSLCQEGLRESYYPIDEHATGKISGAYGGFIKAVAAEKSRVLKGFHIVSAEASEIVQIGQVAIAQEMKAEEFVKLTFPHPTEGELLKEAVRLLCN